MLDVVIKSLPDGARCLDFGCFNWSFHSQAQKIRSDIEHFGCDAYGVEDIPEGAVFYEIDAVSHATPFEDDYFDCVILSHVLEHVHDPVGLLSELVRVCAPGGVIYIEAPSERSSLVKSDARVEKHGFYNFWDDPTHIRPYSPAALYRLAGSFGVIPEQIGYIGGFKDRFLYPFIWLYAMVFDKLDVLTEAMWRANKWASYAIFRKPADASGAMDYLYLSLKGVPAGYKNVLAYRSKRLIGDK